MRQPSKNVYVLERERIDRDERERERKTQFIKFIKIYNNYKQQQEPIT